MAKTAQQILDRFEFVRQLPEASRELLYSSAKVYSVSPNTRLIARDDEVGGVYFVGEGAIRVYYVTDEGREGTLYWVDPGQTCILALNCVFASMKYPAWVESDNARTTFAVVSAPAFKKLFEQEPLVQQFAFDVLSSRTFELMKLLAQAKSLGLECRVAAFLIERSDHDDVVQMSQEAIARHIGTAREVVSRVLRGFARRGWVETSRGAVTILDAEALQGLL